MKRQVYASTELVQGVLPVVREFLLKVVIQNVCYPVSDCLLVLGAPEPSHLEFVEAVLHDNLTLYFVEALNVIVDLLLLFFGGFVVQLQHQLRVPWILK